jgi:hypothetical protein
VNVGNKAGEVIGEKCEMTSGTRARRLRYPTSN